MRTIVTHIESILVAGITLIFWDWEVFNATSSVLSRELPGSLSMGGFALQKTPPYS